MIDYETWHGKSYIFVQVGDHKEETVSLQHLIKGWKKLPNDGVVGQRNCMELVFAVKNLK